MSQLIALIIAIAIGAIITAAGFVFLGDVFTKNSVRAQAINLLNQGQQLSTSVVAYKSMEAKTPYQTNYATTMTELVNENYLKNTMVAPYGEYKMYGLDGDMLLVIDDVIATTGIGAELCSEINKTVGLDIADFTETDTDGIPEGAITDFATGKAILDNLPYACFEDAATATKYVFVYNVG